MTKGLSDVLKVDRSVHLESTHATIQALLSMKEFEAAEALLAKTRTSKLPVELRTYNEIVRAFASNVGIWLLELTNLGEHIEGACIA